MIRFNGVGDDGHETFYIERNYKTDFPQKDDKERFFAFCKTARKPYDTFACCCLIILNYYFGDEFVVSSDGDIEEEWRPAKQVCVDILGYGDTFIFNEDE